MINVWFYLCQKAFDTTTNANEKSLTSTMHGGGLPTENEAGLRESCLSIATSICRHFLHMSGNIMMTMSLRHGTVWTCLK